MRDSLFQMLLRVSAAAGAQAKQSAIRLSSRIVVERLCMSIALIALQTTNSCWTDSVAQVITFGSDDAQKCQLALIVLKYISDGVDTHVFFNAITKHQIETYVRENLDAVLTFLTQILLTRQQNTLPRQCYLEALSAAKSWCTFSTLTFVPNESFVQLLFMLIEGDGELFGKAVGVLKTLLNASKYAKALDHSSEQEAFSSIPEGDRQFLQSIVVYFQRQRENYLAELRKPFNEDDDEQSPFARKLCSLLTCLCANYELLLIPRSEEASALF